MIQLHFDKLYSTERSLEPCETAVPFPKGECRDERDFWLVQDGEKRPVQTQVTSRWEDGSVRWLHVCCLWKRGGTVSGGESADS